MTLGYRVIVDGAGAETHTPTCCALHAAAPVLLKALRRIVAEAQRRATTRRGLTKHEAAALAAALSAITATKGERNYVHS